MRKEIASLIVALLMMIVFPTTVLAIASTADSFQSPLDTYKITGYRFGENEGGGIYHLGEDLKASSPQPVRAIANGVVVDACYMNGYGNVVAIQHTLPDNSQIISIYGHLSSQQILSVGNDPATGKRLGPIIPNGAAVTKGQLVGFIGTRSENGNWAEHLHFGIKKAAYYDKNDRYRDRGMGDSSSYIAQFYKPSDYLNLIRAVGSPVTCRLSNMGNKIWVPSVDTMNFCGWRMDDIRPVTQIEMNRHTTVSVSLSFPSGTFIEKAGSPEISLIKEYADGGGVKNRFRQGFSSWSAFIKAGGKSDQSNVRTVSYDEYNLYTQGSDL
jgi:hypothetical protein